MSGTAPLKPSSPSAQPVAAGVGVFLAGVKGRAEKAGVFGASALDAAAGRLTCRAANSAEPAEYRVDVQQGRVWVSMVTADRWLSESIETDLLHTGDKLDELLEEELAELDYDLRGAKVTFEHFRSEDKLFTFRSALPVAMDKVSEASSIEAGATWLLAYEACFRRLGDMDSAGGEE